MIIINKTLEMSTEEHKLIQVNDIRIKCAHRREILKFKSYRWYHNLLSTSGWDRSIVNGRKHAGQSVDSVQLDARYWRTSSRQKTCLHVEMMGSSASSWQMEHTSASLSYNWNVCWWHWICKHGKLGSTIINNNDDMKAPADTYQVWGDLLGDQPWVRDRLPHSC